LTIDGQLEEYPQRSVNRGNGNAGTKPSGRDDAALVAALEACPVASDGEPDWRGCFVQFLRLLGADQEDAQAKTDQAFGDAQD
jgi:hypothetical protein